MNDAKSKKWFRQYDTVYSKKIKTLYFHLSVGQSENYVYRKREYTRKTKNVF